MPRPIDEQVVVITGASSGIGRAAAVAFGRRGARVVLAAREATALAEAAREVELAGGEAEPVVADVGHWAEVEALAERAVARFGRIDAWVNNAAVSVYGTVEQVEIDEYERVLQVTLLGQIYGVKAALPHLRRQGQGTIVNVASVLAERAVPLQSAYCAAKHGVKGFTESLRLELAREGSDIDVVLILPSAINTPFYSSARSKMGVQPMPMPPVYEPELVADAIVFAAEHPKRDIVVGGAGKALLLMQRLNPSLVDQLMLVGDVAARAQQTDRPANVRDALFRPLADGHAIAGEFGELTTAASPYTRLFELQPAATRAVAAVALLGAALALQSRLRAWRA